MSATRLQQPMADVVHLENLCDRSGKKYTAVVERKLTSPPPYAPISKILKSMFDHRALTTALSRLGCTKISKLEYGLPESNPSLKWSMSLRLLGVYKWEVDGSVKCSHLEATPFGNYCVRELAGDWWKNTFQRQPNLSNCIGFPIAKLAPWSDMHSLNIKDLSAEQSAVQIASDIQLHVFPFVAGITTETRYLELLLGDEKPMQWLFCQPLHRFAEAAWLCRKLGANIDMAMVALARERRNLQGQLNDLNVDVYAERVIQALPTTE